MRVAAIHDSCRKPAFWFVRRVGRFEEIDVRVLENVDGTPVKYGDSMVCGSCQRRYALTEVTPEGGWI